MTVSADFWRHLVTGVGMAALTAAFGALSHTDWSTLGPYAAYAQLATQLLTEAFNQIKGNVK